MWCPGALALAHRFSKDKGGLVSKFFDKEHGRISRAPLSFGLICIGIGILMADTMSNGFGLSSLAVGNIGATIGFAGGVFFQTNCKLDKSGASPQGEKH